MSVPIQSTFHPDSWLGVMAWLRIRICCSWASSGRPAPASSCSSSTAASAGGRGAGARRRPAVQLFSLELKTNLMGGLKAARAL